MGAGSAPRLSVLVGQSLSPRDQQNTPRQGKMQVPRDLLWRTCFWWEGLCALLLEVCGHAGIPGTLGTQGMCQREGLSLEAGKGTSGLVGGGALGAGHCWSGNHRAGSSLRCGGGDWEGAGGCTYG